jgi:CRP-like cAMP-binding protein
MRDGVSFLHKLCLIGNFIHDFAAGCEFDKNRIIDKVLTNIWYKFEKSSLHFNSSMIHEFEFPSNKEIEHFLKTLDLFSTLTEKELKFLTKMSYVKFYGPTEQILQQNTSSSSLYIIYSGSVDIFLEVDTDLRKKVASLNEKSYFGEMSLLTGQLTTASVISNSESYIIQIERPSIAHLFKERPELIKQISEIIIERKFLNTEFMKNNKPKKGEKMGMISQLIHAIKDFFK